MYTTRLRLTLLLPSLLWLANATPAAADHDKQTKPPTDPRPTGSGQKPEPQAPAPGPRRPGERNDEPDPARRARYEVRHAEAVEARHQGRLLVEVGRRTRSPLALLAATQLLARLGAAQTRLLAQVPAEPDAQAPETLIPPRLPAAQKTVDPLDPRTLLQEARTLAQATEGPARRETLAMIDTLEKTEIIIRGAAMGPQQTCDGLSPNVKIIYNVIYEAGEKAVVALSGDGPGELHVTVTDDYGNVIARTPDRSLISWHPRWRSVFRIEVENRSDHRITYCLETN